MKHYYSYQTPVGELRLTDGDNAITGISYGTKLPEPANIVREETPVIKDAFRQIEEYFAGKRKSFDLELAPEGTLFQKKVWEALRQIPYGETRSYRQIAEAAGNVKACRAVGMANNRNPIAIVIPCHRVIGANGKLVGYAGGLNVKEHLLELERSNNTL